jgi:hypothetical protein
MQKLVSSPPEYARTIGFFIWITVNGTVSSKKKRQRGKLCLVKDRWTGFSEIGYRFPKGDSVLRRGDLFSKLRFMASNIQDVENHANSFF